MRVALRTRKGVRAQFVAALVLALFSASAAWAQSNICVRDYVAAGSPPQTEELQVVQDVASSIGLASTPVVVPCALVKKAVSWSSDGSADGVPQGQYIIYNPVWLEEVVGNDRVQVAAVLGHELGHFLNGHFGVRSSIPRLQQETEADRFAGCAVAKIGGAWDALEGLLERLRGEQHVNEDYPDRLASLDAARQGFEDCNGGGEVPSPFPKTAQFTDLVRTCSLSIDVDLSADLIGSIATLYEGDLTKGLASFSSSSDFLGQFDSADRLPAYRVYVSCVLEILKSG